MSNRPSVILYGSPVSLYTGKVRSYMRKSGIYYEERLTCHPKYFSEIMPQVGRYVIPVIENPDGRIIQDTSEIIDHLEGNSTRPSVYPLTPKQKVVSLILELFGDEGLLRPAMHYRWNFDEENDDFISLEFGRFMNPTAQDSEAKELAALPKSKMSALLPALGITPATVPVIEESYKDLLAALDAHFLQYPYLLGGRPSIGDFGLYAPLYAHLARDPAPSLLMKRTANRVWRWVERMTAPDLDKPEFPNMTADFLNNDLIPKTLVSILKLVAKDYGPEISGLVTFLNRWLDANPDMQTGDKVISDSGKRSLGHFVMTVRGQEISVMARHYSVWMLQRVQDAFDELPPLDKTTVSDLLAETGLSFMITDRCKRRIERENHTEVWGELSQQIL